MAAARKRPRVELEESRAECPFTIKLVDPKEKEQKGKKRRKRSEIGEDDDGKKILHQLSPFSPSGKFKTYETMDVHYVVDPPKRWSDMTRYNSFVLNGVKYYSEGFIYVANESTIERQKAVSSKDHMQQRKKSDDDWVARILEIRASDEHHVYARVYWMYWPDELPAGTHDGKKQIQGRQPYHGSAELIASNHMDIINVVSVTSLAQVNQMIEDNDEDEQNALYWRQALDVRTFELSSIDLVCECLQPANPDKTLIGCTNKNCEKWLHDDCLKHRALTKTFERLGTDRPHIKPKEELKEAKNEEEEPKRPLSPKESGGAVSAQHSIDVKAGGLADGEQDTAKVNDNVEVKRMDDDETTARSDDRSPVKSETPIKSENAETAKPTVGRRPGRPRKREAGPGSLDSKARPYLDLFEATLRMDLTPPMMEIKDLRQKVEGGEKSWLEPIECLICGTQIQ